MKVIQNFPGQVGHVSNVGSVAFNGPGASPSGGQGAAFISHSHIDWQIAGLLASFINGLEPRSPCFRSSDPSCIGPGAPWREKVREALGAAGLTLVVATPNAVISPWVIIETAMAFGRSIPVFFLCVGPVSARDLPEAFQDGQVTRLNDEIAFDWLIRECSNRTGARQPSKQLILELAREMLAIASESETVAVK